MDFTLKTYNLLLKSLQYSDFLFQSFQNYIMSQETKVIILRHDVDKLPQNALRVAQIEYELGITGTYFFRIVPQSFKPDIIKKIAALDHEIGYHYEDVYIAYKKLKAKSKLNIKLIMNCFISILFILHQRKKKSKA